MPTGFAVTTAAFRQAVEHLTVDGDSIPPGGGARPGRRRAAGRDDGRDPRGSSSRRPLPADVADAVTAELRRTVRGVRRPDLPVAVRSSATSEDSAEASFAGLQDTYLWVRGADAVLEHVRRCWASLYSVESVTYRLRRGIPETDLAMAVVVQRMVDARSSGVMFTRSPLTGDRSVVAIDASWGLGSAVVSGDVTPDSFVVSKVTGEIRGATVATKTRWHQPDPAGTAWSRPMCRPQLRDVPSVCDDEIAELVAVARKVEAPLRRARRTSSGPSRRAARGRTCSCCRAARRRCGRKGRRADRRRTRRAAVRPRVQPAGRQAPLGELSGMELTPEDVRDVLRVLDSAASTSCTWSSPT